MMPADNNGQGSDRPDRGHSDTNGALKSGEPDQGHANGLQLIAFIGPVRDAVGMRSAPPKDPVHSLPIEAPCPVPATGGSIMGHDAILRGIHGNVSQLDGTGFPRGIVHQLIQFPPSTP